MSDGDAAPRRTASYSTTHPSREEITWERYQPSHFCIDQITCIIEFGSYAAWSQGYLASEDRLADKRVFPLLPECPWGAAIGPHSSARGGMPSNKQEIEVLHDAAGNRILLYASALFEVCCCH